MSLQALDQHEPALPQEKKGKKGHISSRMKRAIDALVTGEARTQNEAADLAGLARSHLCRWLNKPHIQAFYNRRTRETIGRAQMRAAARTVQLIDAMSEHVSLDASSRVLAIAGIAPPQSGGTNVNIINNVAPGYVIKLASVETPRQPSVLPVIDGTTTLDRG